MQNIVKLFTRIATGLLEKNDTEQIVELCNLLLAKLPSFISSGHIEVQERASSAYVLIQMLRDQLAPPADAAQNNILADIEMTEVAVPVEKSNEIPIEAIEIVQEMALLFAGDLNPVAPKAQRKVQIPDGLDLDEWINPPPADSSSSSEDEQTDLFVGKDERAAAEGHRTVEMSKEEMHKVCFNGYSFPLLPFIKKKTNDLFQVREARIIEQSHNPNYLKSSKTGKHHQKERKSINDGCEDIPIAELALEVPLQIICKFNTPIILLRVPIEY